MSEVLYIRNGRVIDPATGRDELADLAIRDGIIVAVESAGSGHDMDAAGNLVLPGLIDLHVHLREPGGEEAETVATGCHAAACGGFTTVVAMPNTMPPLDAPARVARVSEQAEAAGYARAFVAACLSSGRRGEKLADLRALRDAGAVAFTDDGSTIQDRVLMRDAMRWAAELDVPIMDHAEDRSLNRNGVMHEGQASTRHGLAGIPSESEWRMIERDIALSEETGCAMHIQHLSTKRGVELIREAGKAGLPVSGEVTPHHLTLCDEDIDPRDANYKMNPPVRTGADRDALIEGLFDGTLTVLATDHAPHTADRKARGFLKAPFGIIGLETAVSLTYSELVIKRGMPFMQWLRLWTTGPAEVLGRPAPTLEPGAPADVILFNPDQSWRVEPEQFVSRSRNTPFAGRELTGRVCQTIIRGKPI